MTLHIDTHTIKTFLEDKGKDRREVIERIARIENGLPTRECKTEAQFIEDMDKEFEELDFDD